MRIAAIMPCRGRAEQTIANLRRLQTTAGYEDWELWCVCDHDEALYVRLAEAIDAGERFRARHMWSSHTQRGGYWRALQYATEQTDATHLINLANDLLPGQHWLRRAVEAYQATFGDEVGLLGFNGDSHEAGHSCHFLIARVLLEQYGGWPVWYDHNYGDTELCERAIQDGLYAKAPWALLFHDHPYFGGSDDPVYAEGRQHAERDLQAFNTRKAQGWPSASQSSSVS